MELSVDLYPEESEPDFPNVAEEDLAFGDLYLVTEETPQSEPRAYIPLPENVKPELALDNPDKFALDQMSQHRVLSKAEEVVLAKRLEDGDIQAKEELISHNYKLVRMVAGEYIESSPLSLLELVQEGILGLNRAAEKFDWRRDYKFSTYATFWIRQAITLAIKKQSSLIRLPVDVDQRRRNLRFVEMGLTQEMKRQPTIDELAEAANISSDHAKEALGAAVVRVSLNQPVGQDKETEVGEFLADDSLLPIEETVADLDRVKVIRQLVSDLPERERAVLTWRYGLNGEDPFTLEDIGNKLGVRGERVRQIEQRALDRMREIYEHEGVFELDVQTKNKARALELESETPVQYEDPDTSEIYELTAYQETILNLIEAGKTYQQIAGELDLTYGQVKDRAQQAYIKLKATEKGKRQPNTAALAINKRRGLIRQPDA